MANLDAANAARAKAAKEKEAKETTETMKTDGGVGMKPTPDKVKRVTKEIFDKVGDLNPEIYPFKVAVPEGFDFKIHANLKKKDYVGDHLYFEMRAVGAELAAVAFRELAAEAEKMGSTKDRAKAKKLVKMTSKLSELKQQLIAVMGEDAVNKMLEVSENDD